MLKFLALSTLAATALAATTLGDGYCDDNACITAIRSGGTDTWSIAPVTPIPHDNFGWIAIGFGKNMPNSPMVILWPNADETFTLSQREANARAPPNVTETPPRVATLDAAHTYSNSSATSFTFSIPSSEETAFPIIFAYAAINPNSTSPSAPIRKHAWTGHANITLTELKEEGGGTKPHCKPKKRRSMVAL
ncbi:hypothetical protein Q8F55_003319 [Vanrija albida]|uniref:DOMON domain-containing protein n=1 Tax=Vanrija albida TaxID=181172 RepID=A0ABR3Q478_9TREE